MRSFHASVASATLAACSTENYIQGACLVFQFLSGQAPDYLISDCQLVTGSLSSADSRTCNEFTIVSVTVAFMLPVIISGILT